MAKGGSREDRNRKELAQFLDSPRVETIVVVYHDLDHLAGTWDKKDLAEFRKNVEDFEKLDEKMWK